MWRSPEPRYDVASAISQGARDYQEDAIVTDFPFGMDSGVAVLADGMGGHAAGDVASKIVVTEVFSELKFLSANFAEYESEIPEYLRTAAVNANEVVRDHVVDRPETRGMGATLVSLILVENRLYWMSIGDSPLYLLRGGKLQQLNEDHSMAPQIDFMVEQGLMDEEVAKYHPDRNCLTSVILGDKVAKSDCPKKPFELRMGDILVVASDGVQYLDTKKIEKLLNRRRNKKSAEIAGYLLEALDDLADPDQDNISFSVIKLNHMKPVERKIVPKPVDFLEAQGHAVTRVIAGTEVALTPGEDAEPPETGPAETVPHLTAVESSDDVSDEETPKDATTAEAEADADGDTGTKVEETDQEPAEAEVVPINKSKKKAAGGK